MNVLAYLNMRNSLAIFLLTGWLLANSSADGSGNSGKGTCIISGKVEKIDGPKGNWELTLEDPKIEVGQGEGKCSRLAPANYNPIRSHLAAKPGDLIQATLYCHYLGTIHSCEFENPEKPETTKLPESRSPAPAPPPAQPQMQTPKPPQPPAEHDANAPPASEK